MKERGSPVSAAGAPPRDRRELLAQAGESKSKIFRMVRTILDDLEAVAPWEGLYYPPAEAADFLSMETALVGMIRDIPQRVSALTEDLANEAAGDADRELVDNMEFYFQGIQVSVSAELEKLEAKLEGFKAAGGALSTEDRNFTCEISADLKGKYTSSIMGAAAGLIAEGRWQGIEIEPVLFPEKAEEFERNEKLVEALSEVTDDITNLLDRVPLPGLVESWKRRRRVDQYALAPLYSLLGDLGMLMQVTSRRALYSGDYHQIRRRESLLSTRINELTTLHNATWGTVAEGVRHEPDELYPLMVRKATEMAAILDLEVLRQVVGRGAVKDLFAVVTLEKEDSAKGKEVGEERCRDRRRRVAPELHGLIPLLYDEDLKTFLELLLGSVLKRASLTIRRQGSETEAAAADLASAELVPPVDFVGPPVAAAPAIEVPAIPEASGPEPPDLPRPTADGSPLLGGARPAPIVSEEEQVAALERLLGILQPLLSRASSRRKSFELVRRLLKQQRSIPEGLLRSMRPYLYEVMNELIPQLRDDSRLGDMYASFGSDLFDHCQILCDPVLSPESREVDVAAKMEQVLDLLNRLTIAVRSRVERLSGGPETMTELKPLSR